MYFIEDFQDLVGKTIAYIEMEEDVDCVIGTADGGIITFYIDSDTAPEINKGQKAKYFLMNRKYLVDNMIKANMPIEEGFNKMVDEHKKKLQEEERLSNEKTELELYKQYLKLKERFENK